MNLNDLLKRLIDWFLSKSNPRLETFEEEKLTGDGITIIRYRRRSVRAYRTWRAVYRAQEYDLIFGWDTLEYLPDVPNIKKQNRLSTHLVNIYRQGFHARYNVKRRCHEPDIQYLVKAQEVCLEALYMADVVTRWRLKTAKRPHPIHSREEVFNLIIDEIAKYAIRHPPKECDPLKIDWHEVIRQTTCLILGRSEHKVFPEPGSHEGRWLH